MVLTAAEKKLATSVGFDEHVCELVKQHTPSRLRRLIAFTRESEEKPANGLSIVVSRKEVEGIIGKLQPELVARGYRAFWSELYELDGSIRGDEVAILKTKDQYDIIRLRRSSGANYGVSIKAVIKKLRQWAHRFRFEVVGAGGAWVAIRFETLPKNVCEFAEEIYQFCPDTVDQGVGLMDERKDRKAFGAARKLCPKLSAAMKRKLREEEMKVERQLAKMPAEFRALRDTIPIGTPIEMGIRLLAYELKRTKQLFLWWD